MEDLGYPFLDQELVDACDCVLELGHDLLVFVEECGEDTYDVGEDAA